MRILVIGFAAWVLCASTAGAQQWAQRMFSTSKHDFGTVARGAKIDYEFEFQNIYEEDVHITGVRTTCGCTTPYIKGDKRTYKTWEKGAIVSKLNTDSFVGYKGATIIVTIDRPYYAEVQLTVSSRIRSDVVFDPGAVQFGTVEQGGSPEKTIDVSYAGRNNWEIVDVRCANPTYEVELTETHRGGGRVGYEMLVRLKPDREPGYINDQLTLVTDDRDAGTIPLMVEGRVVSSLSVSPASFSLGRLEPGETATKQLVVRGKEPFRIVNIRCLDDEDCFEFEIPSEEKALQFVPLTYTAGSATGDKSHRIEIETDLSGGAKAATVATVTVAAPEATADGS